MNGLHSDYISQEKYKQLIHVSPSLLDLNLHKFWNNMSS
jgi:hypothetical protein